MAPIDIDTLRARIRAMDFERGTPEQVGQWREDYEDQRANLAIEDMPLDAEDDALFAMMVEEGVPPSTMVALIDSIYRPGTSQLAA